MSLLSSVENVCINLPEKAWCFKFARGKSGRFKPLFKDEMKDQHIIAEGNIHILNFVENIDIKKLELPATSSKNLIRSLAIKEIGEDFLRYTFRYVETPASGEFKTYNLFFFDKSDFFIMRDRGIDVYSIETLTYIPFAMHGFSREFKNKRVMHVHIYENYMFILFSVGEAVEFYRVTRIRNDDEILENVVLTFRYIYTSISPVELVLFSSPTEIVRRDDLYQAVDTAIAVVNPYFYFEHSQDGEVDQLFDYIIPAGALKINFLYNFIPEEIKIENNYRKIKKFATLILFVFTILSFASVYTTVSEVFEKYTDLKLKSDELNSRINMMSDKIRNKDIEAMIIRNKLEEIRYIQAKTFNRIVEQKSVFENENYRIKISLKDSGYNAEIYFRKKFDSLKEMEQFAEKLKSRAKVLKDYTNKSVEVFIEYETTGKSN